MLTAVANLGKHLRYGMCAIGSMAAVGAARADATQPATCAAPCSPRLVDGEIRTVSAHGGRITLRHSAIENLGIPAMTMVFRVRDPRWVEGMTTGQPVRFAADRIEGVFTIIHLERR